MTKILIIGLLVALFMYGLVLACEALFGTAGIHAAVLIGVLLFLAIVLLLTTRK